MSELTSEQKILLQQERFVQELLRIRESKAHSNDTPANPWMSFLQSSSGAALITVVLGGICGGLITQLIQIHAQTRESRRLSIAEYAKNQQDISNQAFILIGTGSTAGDDIGDLTEKGYRIDLNIFSPEKKAKLQQQSETTKTAFNSADETLRTNRETIGFRLRIYYHDNPSVNASWEDTVTALAVFMDCRSQYYQTHNLDPDPPSDPQVKSACAGERARLKSEEVNFTSILSSSQEQEYTR